MRFLGDVFGIEKKALQTIPLQVILSTILKQMYMLYYVTYIYVYIYICTFIYIYIFICIYIYEYIYIYNVYCIITVYAHDILFFQMWISLCNTMRVLCSDDIVQI